MGKDNINIKKTREHINDHRRELQKAEIVLVCQCTHQYPTGEVSIRMTNKKKTLADGTVVPIWQCRRCGKEMIVEAVHLEDLDTAIEIVDQVCDAIKFSSNPKNDADQKVVARVAKIQQRVTTELRRYYEGALNSANKRRNRRGGNDRDGGVVVNRPVSH